MKAHLYLHTNFLRHHTPDTEEVVAAKLSCLARDLVEIKRVDPNKNVIHTGEGIYKTDMYPGKNIVTMSMDHLGREERNLMLSVLGNTSTECDLMLNDLLELSTYTPDEQECHAPIVMNHGNLTEDFQHYLSFDTYNIVYGLKSWYHLRHQILGNHPGDEEHFRSCCLKYFPNLFFDEHSWADIKPYIERIPRKIVYHLSCMNDHMRHFYDEAENKDGNSVLEAFSAKFGFEKMGSLQRDQDDKPKLTKAFNYVNANHEERSKELCCECHFKIDKFDDNYKRVRGDNEDDFRARIYFHFGDQDIAGGKVIVYQIGPHV